MRIHNTELKVQEELCRHLFIYFSPVITFYTAVAMEGQRPLTRVRKQCTTHVSLITGLIDKLNFVREFKDSFKTEIVLS